MFVKYRFLILTVVVCLALPWPISSFIDDLQSGDWIIYCINRENGHGYWPRYESGWGDTFAYRTLDMSHDRYEYIEGRVGWHLTWFAILDRSQKPAKAYDTYGMEGVHTGGFGRSKVPVKVIKAIEACGLQFSGVWQGPPPWHQQASEAPFSEE